MKALLLHLVFACLAASFAFAQKIGDDFSVLDTKVWSWKDNVKASLVETSDSDRKKF